MGSKKVMKGYVVTIIQLPQSVQVAQRCVESGKLFNVDVEIVPAADKTNSFDELKKEGLFEASIETEKQMLPSYKRTESNRGAVMGNFVTQYRIWNTILNNKEPGIVLEHDAVFIDLVPNLSGRGDIINLGKPSYGGFRKKTSPGVYPMFSKPGGYIPGAHGYYVTPTGAKELIEKAKKYGASPCDLFLNNKMLPNIKELWPQVVEARDTFTTIQNEVGCVAKHNYRNNKDYKILLD